MKSNLSYVKNVGGLFGVFIYSFFFANSLNASTYSWECEKNRSYLIKEREFVDAKDRLKKFPSKFLANLDEKSKTISLTYDLEKGIASINGNSATITGFPKANKGFKEIPQKSLVISSYSDSTRDSNVTTFFEEDLKGIDLDVTGSSITESKQNNFLLNSHNDIANFVFTEFNELVEIQYKTKNNIPADTLEIEEFIEISIGQCMLLSKED